MVSPDSERILYVEDDEDIREMMDAFLASEGYAVASFRTAEEGLEALARYGCDLLLTDYVLPGENGGWLIQTATARGLLEGVPVIVVSAEHHPSGTAGHRCLHKPVRMDALLAAIEEALASRPRRAPPPHHDEPAMRLVLYVSTPSHESEAAKRNLSRILRALEPAQVSVVVHDVGTGGEDALRAAEEDRVVVVPTLVREAPGPKVWIAGDLSKREYVIGVLGGTVPSGRSRRGT